MISTSIWDLAAYGTIPGITYFNLLGNNGGITTTFEPIWPESAAYTFLAVNMTTPYIASSSANDTAAGTGARTVLITGVDSTFAAQSETLSLNGQTSVNLVNSYMSINSMEVITAGSGGVNAGVIRVGTGVNTAGVPAVVHGHLAVGFNKAQSAIYTVPTGKTLLMKNISLSSKSVTAALTVEFVIDRFVNAGILKRMELFTINQSGSGICLQNTISFAAKSQIAFQALSATSTGPVYVTADCLQIDSSVIGRFQTG